MILNQYIITEGRHWNSVQYSVCNIKRVIFVFNLNSREDDRRLQWSKRIVSACHDDDRSQQGRLWEMYIRNWSVRVYVGVDFCKRNKISNYYVTFNIINLCVKNICKISLQRPIKAVRKVLFLLPVYSKTLSFNLFGSRHESFRVRFEKRNATLLNPRKSLFLLFSNECIIQVKRPHSWNHLQRQWTTEQQTIASAEQCLCSCRRNARTFYINWPRLGGSQTQF